ncbi:MAG: NCS2 family permease [Bacillota bacterium]|uniref:NCS2 family permease n=1 Tax=Virgibacillus salarius TaxID=447199 RepID=A0A941IB43_9BACI|nr:MULTISPECIES: NCS2 family permease [Bacillaceae]NAZ07630.1 NCS2 family permease [Agaribacter marinus]MBR7794910.1 NCS2 family permease [Virgibacillus salarius]MCC2249323.1 NCS2 family permease [Virgibacillus sp. AGTR]MDY7043851.1 NCS2 family permease [Virgibacillus sp. M23]QRZ17356.1 NCS2 family permease [Virgibacillus sp. AGTR]
MPDKKHQHNLQPNSSFKNEFIAGLIGYLTTMYIVVVNGSILSEAGLSIESGMVATILASFVGTVLMGIIGRLPLIIIPGMGINALFAYSIVEGTELHFQEGLAVVLVAAIIFLITAFSKLGVLLRDAIPNSLKHAITVGLGFFLILIGLEKSGLVISGENTIIAIGDFSSATVIVSLLTLFLAIFLFVKNIPANFLLTMFAGTIFAFIAGTIETGNEAINITWSEMLFLPSFSAIDELSFWLAVFPLSMILIFENMGLLHGQLEMLKRENRYSKAYQVTAFSTLTCAFLGTSPTVSAAENAAVIASKGRTGKTALVAGVLFLATLFLIPWITMIPNTAISPILIIVGFLMTQNIRYLPLDNLSECIPALLIVVMIPFTYSIADGMAFGFIAYPIVKIAIGKHRELSAALIVISGLFLFDFIMKIIGI